MRSIAITLPVALLVTGCARHHHFQPSLNITETMTDSSIGAGQGDTVIDNMLVLYGDAETGVAQFYAMDALPPSEPVHTIRLTKDGIDLIQHPTGFTHHPELGTYIGNTVNSVGTIFSVDLDKAIAEGDLDNAITRITDDDLLPRAALWLHGHLHCRHDYRDACGTRVLCNARGLSAKGEDAGWDPLRPVEA